MSKITFRADEELVERLERLDASKSEVMREALRAYLDEHEPDPAGSPADETGSEEPTLDALVAERIDAMLAERLDAAPGDGRGQDLNLTISLEGTDPVVREVHREPRRNTRETSLPPAYDASDAHARGRGRTDGRIDAAPRPSDGQSGGNRDCGKCGEHVADDHVYCPNCGEKASNRVFCECGDEVRSDWAFCPGCGRRTPAADVLD